MAKKNNKNNDSALGKVFAVIGVFAALATGGANEMEGGAIFLLVLFFGFIGYAVGKWVELLIIRVIFIGVAIAIFLMNIAIRRFIWELLSSVFSS